jgi:transposase
MIQITPQMRILVAVESVDFRKGIDSLAELCRQKLDADPFSGCLFVFRSRRATSIKALVYDGQGFWLATKRRIQRTLPLVAPGRGTRTGAARASSAGAAGGG